ncbi:TatD family hydrolase [Thalassobaculum sp. OXR-137]|uniref:TatD family hydrolase n=1 Tax=Thalassobaculum sp. OXR-137 TaxID=3100173 RepID=UPI002AC90B06|nr:TatD family hydrolase [Thalassobaculum sp. OXR-137]WPZ33150.1 TatD family hydrolase [Thalassobaculum sp. OXR-137]
MTETAVPTLVDSHCHLDFDDFAPELDEVVARAERAGIARMVTICTRIRRFERIRAIAERFPQVYCSVGTHPHQAGEERGIPAEEIVALARSYDKVVAIGECGLDYFYDNSPRDAQAEGFRAHIAAARETGLPLIVHTRDADEDTAAILEEEYAKGPFTGVLHCFSSGRELAMRAVDIGFYVSLSGIVTFKKSQDIRDIVADLPADRLLVETDAPFLAPPPHRGKRNEPAYVVHTHRVVAETKGLDEAESARITTQNFLRLFNRVPAPEGFEQAA